MLPKLAPFARMNVLTSPGTGDALLFNAAALPLSQTFAEAGIEDGDLVYYVGVEGNTFEWGVGVYSAVGPTLGRTTVRGSSNGGNLVQFGPEVLFYVDALDSAFSNCIVMQNGETLLNIPKCSPVYISASDTAKIAKADSAATATVVGIALDTLTAPATLFLVQTTGVFRALETQWDAITGQTGGLTPGANYYLSSAIAGRLTTVDPVTNSTLVGVATSSTEMRLSMAPLVAGPPGPGEATPGGVSGQLQYNLAGVFAGFTVGGDGTIDPNTGIMTVLETNGTPFGDLATLDAVDLGTAQVIGNLPVSKLDDGTGASATTAWFGDGSWKEINATVFIEGASYYFDNNVNQELTYKYLNRIPPSGAAGAISATSAALPGTLMGAFETAEGDPNSTSLPAGTYTFHGFGYRASGGGTYYTALRLYLRDTLGNESLAFEILSDPIVSTSAGAPTEWNNEYFLAAPIPKAYTDRLVAKLYAVSANSPRTVNIVIGGTLTSSHLLTPITAGIGGNQGGGATQPGGSTGQVQYNTGSGFGGFTVSGDGTLDTSTGALTIDSYGGVAFGSFAALNSLALSALSDVNVTEGPGIDGYTLNWDNASGKWVATPPVSVNVIMDVTTKTASHILALTDAYSSVQFNSASALTCTVPPSADVAFDIGTEIEIGQIGAGTLTVAPGSGVTILSPQGLIFNRQNLFARLRKMAENTWSLAYYGIPAVADISLFDNGNVSGAVTIDRSKGEAQIITLTGNVTSLAFSNWNSGLSKLTLIVKNTGAFTLALPTNASSPPCLWGGGAAPTITSGSGKEDWLVFATVDSGANLRGNVVNQNYA